VKLALGVSAFVYITHIAFHFTFLLVIYPPVQHHTPGRPLTLLQSPFTYYSHPILLPFTCFYLANPHAFSFNHTCYDTYDLFAFHLRMRYTSGEHINSARHSALLTSYVALRYLTYIATPVNRITFWVGLRWLHEPYVRSESSTPVAGYQYWAKRSQRPNPKSVCELVNLEPGIGSP
jgi:hypothetical protein